jgi:hypothetical protein
LLDKGEEQLASSAISTEEAKARSNTLASNLSSLKESSMTLGKYAAIAASVIARKDPAAALHTATTVLEENFAKHLAKLLPNLAAKLIKKLKETKEAEKIPPGTVPGEVPGRVQSRSKNYIKPNPKAEGAHTVFRTDESGKVIKYETYKVNPHNPSGFDSIKRVDMTGDPHFNKITKKDIPVPHVQGKDMLGGVRPASPNEIPGSFKGK